MVLNYKPVAYDGSWHAAYLIPGTDDSWSSVCDCGSHRNAVEECRRLNGEARAEERATKRDQQLRGIRGQQVRFAV